MTLEEMIEKCNNLYNKLENFEVLVNELREEMKTVMRAAELIPSDISTIEKEDE